MLGKGYYHIFGGVVVRVYSYVSLVLLVLSSKLVWASPLTDEEAIQYYSHADQYIGASLSPDGKHYALWKMDGTDYLLSVHAIGSDKKAAFTYPGGLFNWHIWLDNERIITSVTRIAPSAPVLNIRSVKKRKKRASGLTRQIYVSDIASGTTKLVMEYPLSLSLANSSDDFLHTLPDDPDHFIMAYAPDGGEYPGVYKINIVNGNSKALVNPSKPITTWFVDQNGQIRLGTGWGEEQMEIKLKQPEMQNWEVLSKHPLFKNGRFSILGFDVKSEHLFLRSSLGKGRQAIYQFDMKRQVINKKIFEHPTLDAGTVLLSSQGEAVLGATYVDHVPEIEFFDEVFEAHYSRVKELSGHKHLVVLDIDKGGKTWLLQSLSGTASSNLYIYELETETLTLIEPKAPPKPDDTVNPMMAVKYFSRDGLEIPAYMTLPSTAGKHLPFIIMPHGGPWVRDMMLYDVWAQFFASRGYGVLQPNYRGSAGYGNAFETRSYGEWGMSMQDDLVDSADWLIQQGYADKDRLCIVGGSYGGYAALVASYRDHETFKCAVAFAPVSDLDFWINSVASSKAERKTLMYRTVGSTKRKHLYARSPYRQAQKVKMPVLLIHGSSDIRVAPIHSQLMASALDKYKKPYELIWLPDGSHFLLQQDHRATFLRQSLKLIQETIG